MLQRHVLSRIRDQVFTKRLIFVIFNVLILILILTCPHNSDHMQMPHVNIYKNFLQFFKKSFSSFINCKDSNKSPDCKAQYI